MGFISQSYCFRSIIDHILLNYDIYPEFRFIRFFDYNAYFGYKSIERLCMLGRSVI